MTTTPREASIVRAIGRYLDSLPGCAWEKRHGSVYGKRGEPDITGCLRGRRFELEVKTEATKPTPLQQVQLRRWAEAGAIAGTVRSVADVQALLEEVA